ncbi:hypothetical protein E2C01_026927 [Portunus trituberculatus]|uniref:Uncharacterized protein n=1 Tax=Portunus trituberculatus TaxID=210409 RepID=A0A5B7EHE6_PORTR|nr:hypothetical protein [Portunus trituberculatus]
MHHSQHCAPSSLGSEVAWFAPFDMWHGCQVCSWESAIWRFLDAVNNARGSPVTC